MEKYNILSESMKPTPSVGENNAFKDYQKIDRGFTTEMGDLLTETYGEIEKLEKEGKYDEAKGLRNGKLRNIEGSIKADLKAQEGFVGYQKALEADGSSLANRQGDVFFNAILDKDFVKKPNGDGEVVYITKIPSHKFSAGDLLPTKELVTGSGFQDVKPKSTNPLQFVSASEIAGQMVPVITAQDHQEMASDWSEKVGKFSKDGNIKFDGAVENDLRTYLNTNAANKHNLLDMIAQQDMWEELGREDGNIQNLIMDYSEEDKQKVVDKYVDIYKTKFDQTYKKPTPTGDGTGKTDKSGYTPTSRTIETNPTSVTGVKGGGKLTTYFNSNESKKGGNSAILQFGDGNEDLMATYEVDGTIFGKLRASKSERDIVINNNNSGSMSEDTTTATKDKSDTVKSADIIWRKLTPSEISSLGSYTGGNKVSSFAEKKNAEREEKNKG